MRASRALMSSTALSASMFEPEALAGEQLLPPGPWREAPPEGCGGIRNTRCAHLEAEEAP